MSTRQIFMERKNLRIGILVAAFAAIIGIIGNLLLQSTGFLAEYAVIGNQVFVGFSQSAVSMYYVASAILLASTLVEAIGIFIMARTTRHLFTEALASKMVELLLILAALICLVCNRYDVGRWFELFTPICTILTFFFVLRGVADFATAEETHISMVRTVSTLLGGLFIEMLCSILLRIRGIVTNPAACTAFSVIIMVTDVVIVGTYVFMLLRAAKELKE